MSTYDTTLATVPQNDRRLALSDIPALQNKIEKIGTKITTNMGLHLTGCLGSLPTAIAIASTVCAHSPLMMIGTVGAGVCGTMVSFIRGQRIEERYKDEERKCKREIREIEQAEANRVTEAENAKIRTLQTEIEAKLNETYTRREPIAETELPFTAPDGRAAILRIDAVEAVKTYEDEELVQKASILTVSLYEMAGQTSCGIPLKGKPLEALPHLKHFIARRPENSGPR